MNPLTALEIEEDEILAAQEHQAMIARVTSEEALKEASEHLSPKMMSVIRDKLIRARRKKQQHRALQIALKRPPEPTEAIPEPHRYRPSGNTGSALGNIL